MSARGLSTQSTGGGAPHGKPLRLLLGVWCLVVSMPSCGGETDSSREMGSAFAVRDSAGIRIVESPDPLWTDETGWRVEPDPSVVIRTDERGGPFILHSVKNVVPLEDGRILVENRGANRLLVFSAAGAFLEAWGREGQGPGELLGLRGAFRCPAEGALVGAVAGLVRFAEAGRQFRVYPWPAQVRRNGMWMLGASGSCDAVTFGIPVDGWIRRGDGERRLLSQLEGTGVGAFPAHVLRLQLRSGRVDTITGLLDHQELLKETEGGFTPIPFRFEASFAARGDTVYYGWGERPEVQVFVEGGRLARIVRWGATPEPATRDEWVAYGEVHSGASGTYPPGPDFAERVKPYFSTPWRLSVPPPTILAEDGGNLWIRQYTPPSPEASPPHRPSAWWVFNPEGRWLGEVLIPGNVTVWTIAGDRIYGVSRNELDVETVVVHRVRRGDSSDGGSG